MTPTNRPASGVDRLLDRAVAALADGDRTTANRLAGQVLAVDSDNTDAEDLLAAPANHGEIRRLTIMFVDLVDSTALSTRIEPEVYRTVVGRYRDDVLRVVRAYEGHVGNTKGDGLLAFFGHPRAHEDDVRRSVQAGLDITREVTALSDRVHKRFGFDINVRVGIHRGIVYLDTAQDDVYGLAANLAARVCSLAEPGTVAVSSAIEPLIRDGFDLEARLPRNVKGVDVPVHYFRVLAERDVVATPLGPLVGRSDEHRYLQRGWSQALTNGLDNPGVLFAGDAGIGKSRLAWSAVDMAEHSHGAVLQLIGSPFHTDVGLRPIRRLLERQCGITRTSDADERLRRLRREVEHRSLDADAVVPLLAPVLGIGADSGYEPVHAEGRRLYDLIGEAVQTYLLSCVRSAPSVVLVEDLHWFDETTIEVVQALLRADLGGHVLVVMTSRVPVAVSDLSRTTVFELQPLNPDEVAELTTALHPGATDDEQRIVHRRCDGVPLYIEEVVAKLRQQTAAGTRSVEVPDSLYEALFARLRTSTEALRVVEAAAIIGSRVDRGLLMAATDLDGAAVDEVITQLTAGRVLEPLDAESWRFRHELLREVAAELSPPSIRRTLHSRVADALVSGPVEGNPDWPLIARHYERAERHLEAASAYGRAAANAWTRGALGEARTHLTYAVTQIEQAPPGADRHRLEIDLRLRRALLAQAAEGVSSANAATDFERCLELCSSDLRDDDVFSTVMSLYPYYTMRADLDRAELLVTSIRANLVGSRQAFLPINDLALGMLAWYRGEFAHARGKFDVALKMLTPEAERELEAMLFMPNDASAGLYTHRALSHALDGDLRAAEEELRRVEDRCAQLPFPKGAFSLAYARQIEVLFRIEAGQFDRARQVAGQLTELGQQHGFDSWAMVGAAQDATVSAIAAADDSTGTVDLSGHIATMQMYVDAWRALGAISLVTFYDAVLARLWIAAVAHDEAKQRLDTALDLAESTGMHFYDAELLRLRAHTHDDIATMHADLQAALQLARRQDARVFELRAALSYHESDGPGASEALLEAVSRFPAHSDWPELVRARALLG
ncbi:ATP-binding protein [Mycolicibacterium arseniciresistens]|uniref:Adenylate/guanylate cyclase domain-containing protein n=1 Tax=Mycolicibacterium arseniciresistens TaxID=3062257 RepID=A0ABT8ULG4_9MYCO|nr:adenylate/guanylate cyclase domain-containing protein [Mycolicibacterium arseniciresistens]MDO3637660.1 adenylate/guanylate cyclase domain-containing protein [Mycolicibacterium arseniciresistens]